MIPKDIRLDPVRKKIEAILTLSRGALEHISYPRYDLSSDPYGERHTAQDFLKRVKELCDECDKLLIEIP